MSLKNKPLNAAKKKFPWYFYAVLVLLPVLFFVLLEISLRFFNYGRDIPQWVDGSTGKYIINPELAYRYFYSINTIPTTIEDVFDQKKKVTAYRIFVLGESSAAGYPYMPMGSFSRYIRKRLELAYPSIPIEVVNISLTAINTYTVRDLIPGVLEQKPDLILIYTGHNEYYGALGVGSAESLGSLRSFTNLMLYLNQYKTVQLIRNIISSSLKFVAEEGEEPTGTLMSRMAKDQYIALNSSKYEAGLDQFKKNMRDVLEMIKEKNVPVILGKLVSNLRDQKPFVSVKTEGYPSASSVYNKAVEALANNNISLADSLFRLAKDLDALRFRAPGKINNVIGELGNEFNVPAVNFDSLLSTKSKYGIIGDELMTDHLHPNLEGYQLIGKGFYEAMQKWNMLPKNLKPAVPFDKQDSLTKTNFMFSSLDSLVGNNKIKLLKNDWPFIEKKYSRPISTLFQPKNMMDTIALEVMRNKLSWAEAHIKAAGYYLGLNNIDGFQKHMDIVLYQYPIVVEYFDRVALVLLERKEYDKALKYLEARNEIKPTDYSTKWIGTIALFKGNNDRAIEYLSKSYDLNNKDVQVLYNLAGAYIKKENYSAAVELLRDCLKLNPKYVQASNLMQQILPLVKRH